MSDKQTNSFARLGNGISAAIVLSLLAMPTTSFALGTEDERAACTPDVFRLCGSEIPSVDRIIACMRAKQASLSAPCKAVFAKHPPQTTQNAQNSQNTQSDSIGQNAQKTQ